MKKGLNAFQLKIIAVAAMFCDHIAWAFVDELSAAGQIMHVVGRLTIPIMCFFIAEGLKHTRSLKKYVLRMTAGWLVSAVPFYMFFSEMYGFRQNIIFDLLLALLTAALIGSEASKPKKILGTAALFALSALISGWPGLPIIFVLIFRFIEDRKKRAAVFFCVNTLFVTALVLVIAFSGAADAMGYGWAWYEKLYLYGFSLALIPLHFYNGERGCSETKAQRFFGKYFFYAVYPAHLLLLALIRTAV